MQDETKLLRQVHPSWIDRGRMTSQVFRPTPKDQRRLSVYDGDQIGPAQAWRHYTQSLQCRSAGVVAVTVAECRLQKLQVTPDPVPFPEHVAIDFASLSNSEVEKKSKALRSLAETRGWLHGPLA
jgi:hypothetical protein